MSRIATHVTLRVLIRTRQRQADFDITAREAKLVPALQHAAPVRQAVGLDVLHQYLKFAAFGRYLAGVVPFLICGGLIPQVDSLPEGVVAGIERPSVDVELV